MRKLTLERRIERLENQFRKPSGTNIDRVLKFDGDGVMWCLGLGQMGMPKQFFYGNTIEEVISFAEKELKI